MKDEEKMNPLPVNNEDYESIYKLLGSILFEHGEPSHYLGYLESLYQAAKKSRPAEKLVPSEKDFEQCVNEFSRRLEIKRGFGLVDTDRGWLHGHLKQFFSRFASFKDEKLIPLDKVKIYHLIKKYFFMIPGDTHPTNIIHDNELDNACDEILARFGSVPVVPERKSDGRDS